MAQIQSRMENTILDSNNLYENIPDTFQKYLVAIYRLENVNTPQSRVKNRDIAAFFDIKAPSVTSMLHKLQVARLIYYQKNKTVKLTPYGKRIATVLIDYHHSLESLLQDYLKMDNKSIVHNIAQQLQFPYNNELHFAIRNLNK